MKTPKIKKKCLACGKKLPEPLLILDNMPCGAQSMPDREHLSEDKGISLPLCRCHSCGLVQFDCEPVDYYREAIRVVGLSETMRDLRRADFRKLIEDYGLAGKKWIEIGCGNGDFLKVLEEFPAEIFGTEESEANLREAAYKLPDAGLVRFFPGSPDMDIPGGPFDCFLSFNFLEHQPDPSAMLGCAWHNLVPGGTGLITVPSFEYIINNGRCYELIRDHIANYTLGSLEALSVRCGFSVLEKGFIGIGDTIRLIVKKEETSAAGSLKAPGRDYREEEKISRLIGDYARTKKNIAEFVNSLKKQGRSLALWGAGHQCFAIAATTALKDFAKYIIDSSVKKQGLYAPASHLLIVSPDHYGEDPADVIMITAPGYVREIEKNIRERYGSNALSVCDIIDLGLR